MTDGTNESIIKDHVRELARLITEQFYRVQADSDPKDIYKVFLAQCDQYVMTVELEKVNNHIDADGTIFPLTRILCQALRSSLVDILRLEYELVQTMNTEECAPTKIVESMEEKLNEILRPEDARKVPAVG